MTDTATLVPLNAVQNREDFKTFFLQLLEEDAAFCHKIKAIFLEHEKKATNKKLEPLPPTIPFSEMPYWKQRIDFKKDMAAIRKKYALK